MIQRKHREKFRAAVPLEDGPVHGAALSDADDPSLRRLQALMGRRLRDGRLILGLSEEAVAHELSITVQNLRGYECGEIRIPPRLLTAAAEALHLDLDWFFHDDMRPAKPGAHYDHTLLDFLSAPGADELIAAFLAIEASDSRRVLIAFARMLAGRGASDRPS